MSLKAKLNALKQIYQVYDEFIQTQDLACRKYCSICCTCDVTLTTLEGRMIIDALSPAEIRVLLSKLAQKAHPGRLLPDITTNHLAHLCAQGRDFAETDRRLSPAACPLLTEHSCPVYDVRPFGCRSLVSHINCENSGFATTNDYILSINTLFLQVMEHLDSGGRLGNLSDVLIVLEAENRSSAAIRNRPEHTGRHLIRNQPLKVLMLPPEHRVRIQPILASLQKITLS